MAAQVYTLGCCIWKYPEGSHVKKGQKLCLFLVDPMSSLSYLITHTPVPRKEYSRMHMHAIERHDSLIRMTCPILVMSLLETRWLLATWK